MINYQPFPTEAIPIVPPRDAHADPRTSLDRLRARFVRNDGLPFADVLTGPRIEDAFDEHGVRYRDRVFNPVTTLWGFLSQFLSEDHSCRDAVTRIIAHRAASGPSGPARPIRPATASSGLFGSAPGLFVSAPRLPHYVPGPFGSGPFGSAGLFGSATV